MNNAQNNNDMNNATTTIANFDWNASKALNREFHDNAKAHGNDTRSYPEDIRNRQIEIVAELRATVVGATYLDKIFSAKLNNGTRVDVVRTQTVTKVERFCGIRSGRSYDYTHYCLRVNHVAQLNGRTFEGKSKKAVVEQLNAAI